MKKDAADELSGGKANSHIIRAFIPKPLHERLISLKGQRYIDRITNILQEVIKDPWKLRKVRLYHVRLADSERINDVRGRLSTKEMRKLDKIRAALELTDADILINALAQSMGENLSRYKNAVPIDPPSGVDAKLEEIVGKRPKSPITPFDPDDYDAAMKESFAQRVRE